MKDRGSIFEVKRSNTFPRLCSSMFKIVDSIYSILRPPDLRYSTRISNNRLASIFEAEDWVEDRHLFVKK